MMEKEELVQKLLDLGCYKQGKFTLKSGKISDHYFDFRHLVSYPKILKEVCRHLYELIKDTDEIICGLPYAGMPYSQTISVLYDRPLVLLRKEKKKHGTGKILEGIVMDKKGLIIIDDILTTGESVVESLQVLKGIRKILVILDRGEGGRERLESMGYQVESLFKVSDFITK